MNINSRKNNIIALYRSLLRSAGARRENKMFVAEGQKLCREAVSSGLVPVSAVFTGKAAEKYPELYEIFAQYAEISIINEDLSEYISDTKTPQGVFALFRVLDKIPNSDTIYSCDKIIVLDRLQDPGNVGTIIRSADAFGIDAMIMSGCADIYSPKILRSAAGSVFRLPIYTGFFDFAAALTENNFTLYAAVLSADSEKLGDVRFPRKTAVIIGNEGNGVSKELIPLAKKLYIPINRAESLNAAVAASVIMYELSKS